MKTIRSILSIFLSRQFAIYLVAGAVPTVANFASGAAVRAVSTSHAGMVSSMVVGYVVGTVVAFFLHRRFTFGVHGEPMWPQAVRFGISAIPPLFIAVAVADGVLWLWDFAGAPGVSRGVFEHAAHVVAIGVNTIYGFLIAKFFALKSRRDPGVGKARLAA